MEVRHDTDIGGRNQSWESVGQWFAGIMDPVGRFGRPFVRQADEVPYFRTLRWILPGTEHDFRLMRRYELVGRAKLYNSFYLIKGANDWNCELTFERRQRTNPKRQRRRYIGRHNLKNFALPGRDCSKLYAVVPES